MHAGACWRPLPAPHVTMPLHPGLVRWERMCLSGGVTFVVLPATLLCSTRTLLCRVCVGCVRRGDLSAPSRVFSHGRGRPPPLHTACVVVLLARLAAKQSSTCIVQSIFIALSCTALVSRFRYEITVHARG